MQSLPTTAQWSLLLAELFSTAIWEKSFLSVCAMLLAIYRSAFPSPQCLPMISKSPKHWIMATLFPPRVGSDRRRKARFVFGQSSCRFSRRISNRRHRSGMVWKIRNCDIAGVMWICSQIRRQSKHFRRVRTLSARSDISWKPVDS